MATKGRFSRLDFDDRPEGPGEASVTEQWPNLDEHQCIRRGDHYFDRGEYDTALAAYSRALRFNRDFASAWVGQIRCLIGLGEYPEAVAWSDRALEKFPKSADLLACKGLALALIGDINEGAEYLDGALQMRSPSAWVWLARGRCYLLRPEMQDGAHRCFLKACETEPDGWQIELQIGMAYNTARMFARARTALMNALRKPVGDENPLILYHTGLALEGLGELAAAAGYFERALSVKTNYIQARDALQRVQGVNPVARLWRGLRQRGMRKQTHGGRA